MVTKELKSLREKVEALEVKERRVDDDEENNFEEEVEGEDEDSP